MCARRPPPWSPAGDRYPSPAESWWVLHKFFPAARGEVVHTRKHVSSSAYSDLDFQARSSPCRAIHLWGSVPSVWLSFLNSATHRRELGCWPRGAGWTARQARVSCGVESWSCWDQSFRPPEHSRVNAPARLDVVAGVGVVLGHVGVGEGLRRGLPQLRVRER